MPYYIDHKYLVLYKTIKNSRMPNIFNCENAVFMEKYRIMFACVVCNIMQGKN